MRKTILTSALCGLLIVGGVSMTTSCSGGNNRLKIVHFDQTILGDASKDLGVSIGVKKENTELRNLINQALENLSQDTRNTWMSEANERSTAENVGGSGITTAPYDENKETLTDGIECDYSPFNWTEVSANEYTYPIEGHSGQYADGYDIQVAKYLADALDYNLKIVKLGWEALIPALQDDTINLVIAGMTDTEERRLSIDFTDEYYRSELVLIVKENSAYASATSLEDFRGAKIVSQVSTVTDSVIDTWTDTFGVIHQNPLDKFSTCAIAVQNGTVDAMTAELPVATSIVNGANR